MLTTATIDTLGKQLVKAERDLAKIDARVAQAREFIASADNLRDELHDRISYLTKVRARKLAELPAAAADGETPVLNTDLEAQAVPVEIEVAPVVYSDADPRLTSGV